MQTMNATNTATTAITTNTTSSVSTKPTKFTILGGGPGGLLLARLLTQAGLLCEVLETDASLNSRHQGGMLDIHEDTGQRALRQAELYDAFTAAVLPGADAMLIRDQHAAVHLDLPGNGERPEIDRGSLRNLLVASLPEGVIRWNTHVASIQQPSQQPSGSDGGFDDGFDDGASRFVLKMVDGQEEVADVVIGADGAWSRVRPLLTDVKPVYSGVTFAELRFRDAARRFPAADRLVGDGTMFALADDRGFIGHREPDGEIDVYAIVRLPETEARAGSQRGSGVSAAEGTSPLTSQSLLPRFAAWHSDFQSLLAHNDGCAIRPLYALPVGLRWPRVPGATLLGDAAHLMSPFAGEGVNQALADAADLAEQIIAHPDDLDAAFDAYEAVMYRRSEPLAAESARMLDVLIAPDPLPAFLGFFADMGVTGVTGDTNSASNSGPQMRVEAENM